MKTPIYDFVRRYAESNALRLHMPGHKGTPYLGVEQFDITEISGADSLYEASGIISQSEANASRIFGCPTFYSAEGSSQCIRAMLYLVSVYAKKAGEKPLIAASRNVHKTFVNAAAMLDMDVLWLYPKKQESYLSCNLEAVQLDEILSDAAKKPAAVYLTSPDYLGNIADVSSVAKVCHKHGVLLIVDNAHGAYLKFLKKSQHPIDLGADMCCDSAHKTLPVLTGGAYLHVSNAAPTFFTEQAKNAMALFGSTSPSYLILQSLDRANLYLNEYPKRLFDFVHEVDNIKERLAEHGYSLYGNEPLKITIASKAYGYKGDELSGTLEAKGIVCEFADPDFVVLMLTPEIGGEGLGRLADALISIPRKVAITDAPPRFSLPERVLTIREAVMSAAQDVPISQCAGRIVAAATVCCPPAVPILVCGERIDESAIKCFEYYGTKTCTVVR